MYAAVLDGRQYAGFSTAEESNKFYRAISRRTDGCGGVRT